MILLTGGVKSGKSLRAQHLAMECDQPRVFIATGVPFDEEMRARIERHKTDRGEGFILREEPVEIHKPLAEIKASVYVIDCMTTWLANLLHYGVDVPEAIDRLFRALTGREIVVTNEVGWGLMPAEAESRKYIDLLGGLNKRLAGRADEVYLMASGLPLRLK